MRRFLLMRKEVAHLVKELKKFGNELRPMQKENIRQGSCNGICAPRRLGVGMSSYGQS